MDAQEPGWQGKPFGPVATSSCPCSAVDGNAAVGGAMGVNRCAGTRG